MKAYQYNIAQEMLIDNFAGGGGASTGIELATGRQGACKSVKKTATKLVLY